MHDDKHTINHAIVTVTPEGLLGLQSSARSYADLDLLAAAHKKALQLPLMRPARLELPPTPPRNNAQQVTVPSAINGVPPPPEDPTAQFMRTPPVPPGDDEDEQAFEEPPPPGPQQQQQFDDNDYGLPPPAAPHDSMTIEDDDPLSMLQELATDAEVTVKIDHEDDDSVANGFDAPPPPPPTELGRESIIPSPDFSVRKFIIILFIFRFLSNKLKLKIFKRPFLFFKKKL